MRLLTFDPSGMGWKARRIRAARFEERSSLPASAACVVGNGVRETLTSLLGAAVGVRVLEPAIPSPPAWVAIAREALLYRTRGSVADAAIVLRPRDAAALAAAAFGENRAATDAPRDLSPFEREAVDRAAAAIGTTLQAVCGARERESLELVSTIAGFATYFEILLEPPIDARIGIALSRDPAPEPRGRLALEDLAGILLEPVVTLDVARIRANALATLTPGTIFPLTRAGALHGRLTIGGRQLARGTCGMRDGRYAFAITSSP